MIGADSALATAERHVAEKALAYAEFLRNNRLYAFREATKDEKMAEAAAGEKLFMPPNPKQAELLRGWLLPEKKVFTFTGGNRLGKTTIGAVIGVSTLFGRWLWDDREIDFVHRHPRRVRYIGQGWESHIKAVVVPALKFWWPKNRPLETKKNNQAWMRYGKTSQPAVPLRSCPRRSLRMSLRDGPGTWLYTTNRRPATFGWLVRED